jgi:hypothetical protein
LYFILFYQTVLPAIVPYSVYPDQRVQYAAFDALSQSLAHHGHEFAVEQGQAVLKAILAALQAASNACPKLRKVVLGALITFVESVDIAWLQESIGKSP